MATIREAKNHVPTPRLHKGGRPGTAKHIVEPLVRFAREIDWG